MVNVLRFAPRRLAAASVAIALGMGAIAIAPQTADARVFVGVGVGVPMGYYYPPPVYYYPPPPVVYAPPPPPPVVYQAPAPAAAVNPASPEYIAPNGQTCREYQSSVMINGVQQPSHGTACCSPTARGGSSTNTALNGD